MDWTRKVNPVRLFDALRRIVADPRESPHPLQRSRASQRSSHVVASHFLSTIVDRITNKNYITFSGIEEMLVL
jgi:hypothetical protein